MTVVSLKMIRRRRSESNRRINFCVLGAFTAECGKVLLLLKLDLNTLSYYPESKFAQFIELAPLATAYR